MQFAKYLWLGLYEKSVFVILENPGGNNKNIFPLFFANSSFTSAQGQKKAILLEIFEIIGIFKISKIGCFQKVKI